MALVEEFLAPAEVERLASARAEAPHISIYFPVEPANPEKNRIHLKNARQTLANELGGEHQALLEAFDAIDGEGNFRGHNSKAFAMFASDELTLHGLLPYAVEPITHISRYFYLKPLHSLVQNSNPHYVIALSLNHTRLFLADAFGCEEIAVDDVDTNISDALGAELTEPQLQSHSGSANGQIFHGQGAGQDDRKKDIRKFFLLMSEQLEVHCRRDIPIIVCGVDVLLPLYSEASSHRQELKPVTTGNIEFMSEQEIHTRLADVLSTDEEARQLALERYAEAAGANPDRVETDWKILLAQAFAGRVDILFVRNDAQQYGTFDANEFSVSEDQDASWHNHDLLDLVCTETRLKGGSVYLLGREQMPAAGVAAGILRY